MSWITAVMRSKKYSYVVFYIKILFQTWYEDMHFFITGICRNHMIQCIKLKSFHFKSVQKVVNKFSVHFMEIVLKFNLNIL